MMVDVTLSSIKGGDVGGIRSRDLSGAVTTTTSNLVLGVDGVFSAGVTSANVFKEVINISGKGWLLSCAVKNSDFVASNPGSNIISGKLIIDGIEAAATSFSVSNPSAGIMFLGSIYSTNFPQPSATPVRFEQGFSLQVASSINRSASPFIGWHLLYLLD